MESNWKSKVRTAFVTSCRIGWRLLRTIIFPAIVAVLRFLYKVVFPAIRNLFMRLPRNYRVAVSLLGVIVVVAAALYINFEPKQRATVNTQSVWIKGKEGKLVRQLLTSDSWDEQRKATKNILQLAGFTVIDDDKYPDAEDSLFIIAPELSSLTSDAIRKATVSHLTLNELALFMADMDFPFDTTKDQAVLLQSSIRNWVKGALDDPSLPGASVPIFLYAMALQQQAPLDLTSENWSPLDYHLTYLEIYVFLSSFLNSEAVEKTQTSGFMNLTGAKVYAAENTAACSYAKDWLNKLGDHNNTGHWSQFNGSLLERIASELTGLAIDNLADMGKLGQLLKKILVPLNAILKIQKLVMLYGSLEFTVSSEPPDVHKPTRLEPGKEVKFIATAGVDEKKYNEHLEQWNARPAAKDIKDCLSFFGLPMPTDMSDLTEEVQNWDVAWRLYGNHAQWGTAKNKFKSASQLSMPIKKISKTHGEATFIVDVNPEETNHEGDMVTGYITARSTLRTDIAPMIGTYLNAAKYGEGVAMNNSDGKKLSLWDLLGLGDLAVETVSGWVQRIIDPSELHYVPVTYHKHRFPDYSYIGTFSASSTMYEGGTGPYHISFNTIPATFSTRQTNSYTGKLETTKMSTTPNTESTYWGFKGEGTMSVTYRSSLTASGKIDCIGGSNGIEIISKGSGSDSESKEATATMSRSVSDKGEYSFNIRVAGETMTLVHPHAHQRIESPSGCIHVRPSNNIERHDNYQNGDIRGLNDIFITKEAYPETIKGSTSIQNSDGSVTQWHWNFIRIDLSDDPTFIDAVAG